MKTIKIKMSDSDYQKYNLTGSELSFSALMELIEIEQARNALNEANTLAENYGLSKMSLEEINSEITAIRDGKTHS